jgi:hypothetical protein
VVDVRAVVGEAFVQHVPISSNFLLM